MARIFTGEHFNGIEDKKTPAKAGVYCRSPIEQQEELLLEPQRDIELENLPVRNRINQRQIAIEATGSQI